MTTKTIRDPEVQGNNEPSGRFNLVGQQKPQYLIDAIKAKDKAREVYYEVAYNWKIGATTDELKQAVDATVIAEESLERAYDRYNEECKNANRA